MKPGNLYESTRCQFLTDGFSHARGLQVRFRVFFDELWRIKYEKNAFYV